MLQPRALETLAWHSLYHGSFVSLLFLGLSATFTDGTTLVVLLLLFPMVLMLLHTIAYIGYIRSGNEFSGINSTFQWLLLAGILVYGGNLIIANIFNLYDFLPSIHGWLAIVIAPLFLFLQGTAMATWLNRRNLNEALDKSKLILTEAIQHDQVMVQKAWYNIKNAQTKNVFIAFSGLVLFLFTFLNPGYILPSIVLFLVLLIGYFMCASSNNLETYEHQLFEYSLRLPKKSRPNAIWTKVIIISLASILAMLIPFRFMLPQVSSLEKVLAWFLSLFQINGFTREQLSQLTETMNSGAMESQSLEEDLPVSTTISPTPQWVTIFWIVIGVVLFIGLVLVPIWLNRHAIVQKFKGIFSAIKQGFSFLIFGKKNRGTSSETSPLPRETVKQVLKRLVKTSTREKKNSPRNRIIKVYAEFLMLFINKGLVIQESDTCESIEDKILILIQKELIDNSQLEKPIIRIRVLFSEEVYGPISIEIAKATQAEAALADLKSYLGRQNPPKPSRNP